MPAIPSGLDRPLRFAPVYQTVVWGGRRLETWRKDLPDGPIGESWELSQQARGMSVVVDGPLAGQGLDVLMRAHGALLVGTGYDGSAEFPLLIKIIDAADRLSVQVHPDDALAQRFGVGRRGKTECWYFLADGGELFQGTRPGVDAAAFGAALVAGRTAECLNRYPTRTGDFFFLPARTVHALGGGCLLFEVQQSCDCTFRVDDWGRVGLDGRPRPLHVAESLATIDFTPGAYGPVEARRESLSQGGSRRALVTCDYFTVQELVPTGLLKVTPTPTCTVVMTAAGGGRLATAAGGVELGPLQTALIPACAGGWTWTPAGPGSRLLLARPR